MKTYTTTADTIRTAYERHEMQTATTLRAKHSTSGTNFLTDLQNHRTADDAARLAPALAELSAEHEAAAADQYKTAAIYAAIVTDTTRTKEEKTAAAALEKYHREEAKKHTAKAEAIDSGILGKTLSDRADIVHNAYIATEEAARLAYVITPADMDRAAATLDNMTEAAHNHEPATPWAALDAGEAAAVIIAANAAEWMPALAYDAFLFRAGVNAAGQAITAELHHSTLNRTTTTATLATSDQLTAWLNLHGQTGKGYKVPTGRDGLNWYTMEYRQYKRKPCGWYLVYHQRTISPKVSLEAYTENSNGEEFTIITNGGIPFIETQEAAERIAAIMDTANLTKRERDFLAYFLSTTARHKAEQAAQAMTGRPTRKDMDETRYNARLAAAYDHIGIYAEDTRRQFMHRLKVRVKAAAEAAKAEPQTAAEKAWTAAKDWERMQSNRTRRRGMVEQEEPAAILEAVTAWASTKADPAPAVAWKPAADLAAAVWHDARPCPNTTAKSGHKAEPPAMTERERIAAADRDRRLAELEANFARLCPDLTAAEARAAARRQFDRCDTGTLTARAAAELEAADRRKRIMCHC